MDPLYGQRTTYPKNAEQSGNWALVDAKDKILGRLASQVAQLLMGKNRADYHPGVLTGSRVVIINAADIKVSGNKMDDKLYHRHTGYFGGLKTRNMKTTMEQDPKKVLEAAIKGMLPRNKLGRKMMTRLRIFPGSEHNLEAQNPQPVKAS